MPVIKPHWVLALGLAAAAAAQAQTTLPVQLQNADQTQLQTQSREQIYRGELLSEQERLAYLERMRQARTEQEREQIRQEHRERMDARQSGVHQKTPDPQGSGMGRNQGGQAPVILPKQGGGRN